MNEQRHASTRDDEIDLGALWRRLRQRAGWVLGVTAIGLVATFAVAQSYPPVFLARATLIPTDSSSDRLSSALAPFTGFALPGVIPRGDGEKLVGLLGSRVLAERVITRHHFLPQLGARGGKSAKTLSIGEASLLMSDVIAISADKATGIIEVRARHPDPHVSAGIANAYVDELRAFLKENSFTAAKRQREFLQKQVEDLTGEIQALENRLIAFQEQHRLVSLDAQTQATIQAYASLKSQLIAKETELKLQENSVSPLDAELVGLKQEVKLLREELTGLETGATGGLLAFKDAPQLGVRYGQFQRDLTVKQKVFELLTQQLELAKIEETRDTLTFQVIDRAAVPEFAKKTERTTAAVVGAIASLVLGILVALSMRPRPKQKRPRPSTKPKEVSQRLVPIPREGL